MEEFKMKNYETIIGLEVHVELATESKIFCSCSTRFGGEPNTQCCPVCTGMPGTLPVLNKTVVEYAIAGGLALKCNITSRCQFDRKNYFYPDLPKAYQISQLYYPICRDGWIEIDTDIGRKMIGIHEIHMEEDAGKLVHDSIKDCTLIDYNRSGVPLIEIVSEPDLRNAKEAVAYLDKLRITLQYLGVSDCKMQEGSLRVDINLSVREVGTDRLGTRTEMKNLNSFKSIARAIESESIRQIELIERGEKVIQETRRWDDKMGISYTMRAKEEAQDYRYFLEPDIPPIEINPSWIEEIRKKQPEFREEKMQRYVDEFLLPTYDAGIITENIKLAGLFEATVALCGNPKEVSNWIMVETMRLLNEKEMDIEDLKLKPEHLSKLIMMIDENRINRTIAREVFEIIFTRQVEPEEYVESHGLGMVTDDGELRNIIDEILAQNPQSVEDYRNEKTKAIGFLMGKTMKAMDGRADPNIVNRIIIDYLDNK